MRDGFSLAAALLGPVWLAWRGAWLAFMVWVVAVGVLVSGAMWANASSGAAAGAIAALCLLTGLEAPTILGRGLRRRGYALSSIIDRRSLAEAEAAHFSRTLAASRAPATAEQIGVYIEGST